MLPGKIFHRLVWQEQRFHKEFFLADKRQQASRYELRCCVPSRSTLLVEAEAKRD
jgi:hypothetical protein